MQPRDDDIPDAALDPEILLSIGLQLRQLYDHIVAEPVPDRLKVLLDRLDAAERRVRQPERFREPSA